ncbi:Receptor-like protein [Arachis hypogaea]|nr:Receptor-like protein [Arachis hypogaea]
MGWFVLPSFVLYFLTFLLLIIHIPSYTSSSAVLPLCNHDDSSNLLQFKNSFAVNTSFYKHLWWRSQVSLYCSSYPKTASWNNNTDCCQWDGVTCDTTSGHVIGLDLSCSMLQGELNSNSTLFHLTHLQQLNLAYNDLSASPLSSRIGDLAALTHLNLSNSALGGDIPFTISHLSKLLSLDLSRTDMLDELGYSKLRFDPSTWNKLILNTTNLKELVLDEVNMSSIRESSLSLLMNLSSSLVSLSLRHTKLQGNFPIGILGLPNLQELTLQDNQDLKVELPKSNWSTPLRILELSVTVSSGEIPDSIGHLRSLKQLGLGSCQFDGLVPLSLWNLTQLTELGLAENTLHGEIPSLLSNLKHLTFLDLSANNFNGHIPDVFHNLTKLESLSLESNSLGDIDLSNNKFVGPIGKFSTYSVLTLSLSNNKLQDLSFNQLQGELPVPPNGLQIFSVSNNNFTGNVSSAFCNASSLSALILSHNHLSGMIPQCLGAFLSLRILDLQVNNFHGSIPTNFSQGNQFQTIKLNHNQLEGSLPKSLANCTSLEVLDLAENNIEDVFPSWLEMLQELKVLSLRANKFHGTITSLSAEHPFPKLRIFDVSNNKFSGPLPTSFFQNFQGMKDLNDSTHHPPDLSYMTVSSRTTYNDSVVVIIKGQSMELVRILTTFTTIDLSNNMFEGGIPHVIGELSSLKGLNLSHNKISGMIPQTLGNLTSLEWLDLSWNQLKGEIPMALTNLNFLAVLNLSENQLKGMIPTGEQFNTFQNDSYRGNPMLCGFPLSKSCSNDEEQPPSVFAEAKESLFGWKSVAVGYGCGVVFGMFLGRLFIKTAKPLWLARLLCGYN